MSFPVNTVVPRFPAMNPLHMAAGLSLLAGLVHIWVMLDHIAEWWGFGVFFLLLANVQWAYGLALLNRPGRNLVLIGIYTTLVVIALYVVHHTTGVPFFGPHRECPRRLKCLACSPRRWK